MDLREAIRAVVRGLAQAHGVSPRLHSEFESHSSAKERLQFISFLAGFLSAHPDESRRPNASLAAELFYDASVALIHGMALRNPDRLEQDDWLSEVCDLLTRYLIAD